MQTREFKTRPVYSGAAVALVKDGEKILFLERIKAAGQLELVLPGCELEPRADPVASLVGAVRQQTGIDGQVMGVAREERVNVGSRKNRKMVPLLVFKVVAKSNRVSLGSGFAGFKWLFPIEARKRKLAKNALWV